MRSRLAAIWVHINTTDGQTRQRFPTGKRPGP